MYSEGPMFYNHSCIPLSTTLVPFMKCGAELQSVRTFHGHSAVSLQIEIKYQIGHNGLICDLSEGVTAPVLWNNTVATPTSSQSCTS